MTSYKHWGRLSGRISSESESCMIRLWYSGNHAESSVPNECSSQQVADQELIICSD